MYPASDPSSAAELPQSPPGGATTFQSPPSQTTSIWTEARTVAPLVPGTYRVTVHGGTSGGAVADLNAQALGADYLFTFTVDASL